MHHTSVVGESLGGISPQGAPGYLIDTDHAIIVDVEATPTGTYDEVVSTKTMLDRTDQRFSLTPERLAADTAYGTGKFLAWLRDQDITPHIPVRNTSRRKDGTLSRGDFTFDKERDLYIGPQGKLLKTMGKVHDGNKTSAFGKTGRQSSHFQRLNRRYLVLRTLVDGKASDSKNGHTMSALPPKDAMRPKEVVSSSFDWINSNQKERDKSGMIFRVAFEMEFTVEIGFGAHR